MRQLGEREYLAISPHQIPQPMGTGEGDVRPSWKRLGEGRGQDTWDLLGKKMKFPECDKGGHKERAPSSKGRGVCRTEDGEMLSLYQPLQAAV